MARPDGGRYAHADDGREVGVDALAVGAPDSVLAGWADPCSDHEQGPEAVEPRRSSECCRSGGPNDSLALHVIGDLVDDPVVFFSACCISDRLVATLYRRSLDQRR